MLYRTQLFNPADIDNVKKIQAGYKVEPLSAFLGKPAPAGRARRRLHEAAQRPSEERTSPEFFDVLNFILQFCPTNPSEKELMARFAKIGIGAGKTFDAKALSPEMRKAIAGRHGRRLGGVQGVQGDRDSTPASESSADVFGTREFLKNDYHRPHGRRGARHLRQLEGRGDLSGLFRRRRRSKPLDGANRYTLRFAPGQLPPVNAFWSLTMYELPASLLYANPLNRYLINSPMLPSLKRDADGGITLYVQNESPGADKEANWLPAPKGPFFAVHAPLLAEARGARAANGRRRR